VHPTPIVTFSGLNGGYCVSNAAAILTGNPTGGSFSGPGISGTTFDPAIAGLGTHTISYVYIDGNGCSGIHSQNTVVTGNAFVSLGPDTMVCDDAPAFILNPGNFSSYLWQDNSTNSVFSVSAVTLGIGFHTFYVGITDANGCVGADTTVVEVIICVGGMEHASGISFVIIPNPADEFVMIQFMQQHSPVTIEALNLQGQIVTSVKETAVSNGNIKFDVSAFSAGIYFIRVSDGENETLQKLIVK